MQSDTVKENLRTNYSFSEKELIRGGFETKKDLDERFQVKIDFQFLDDFWTKINRPTVSYKTPMPSKQPTFD